MLDTRTRDSLRIRKKVLVINEQEGARKLYMDRFEESGYIVLEAENLDQGMEVLGVWEKSAEIDLFLFDFKLPEAGQIEMINRMIIHFPKIAIILISEDVNSPVLSPLKNKGNHIAFIGSNRKEMATEVANSFLLGR